MQTRSREYAGIYQGLALIADPIYRYASFTVPLEDRPSETTEKDLIDSPWIQRLRRIYQLQSARFVYPAAEHSRFQHSLGTMHMAGEFGRHLYPSLKATCAELPSPNFVEEILRIAGLLHDVGHGPYGHFFDDHYLSRYRITHETLGQAIIRGRLGELIREIRRSPSGNFASGEGIDPAWVAYLIKMPSPGERKKPGWLRFLRQLFSGIYTVDNLDYVKRDAFMTGFSLDMVDIERLRFYSFFSKDGLTLHQAGVSALSRFLNARLNLYANVYFHRTTRALDIHLQEIFPPTMSLILPENPLNDLDQYGECDEWFLYHKIKHWLKEGNSEQISLGREWDRLYRREVKWKMSYATDISLDEIHRGAGFLPAETYEESVRRNLPASLRGIAFRVDMATQDPRPLNPMAEGERRVSIYNPASGAISREPLKEIYRFIPARVVHFRIFSLSHDHDDAFTRAGERALSSPEGAAKTNI